MSVTEHINRYAGRKRTPNAAGGLVRSSLSASSSASISSEREPTLARGRSPASVGDAFIGAHNEVVTQFQGDAVLATFNVPVEDAGHAGNAFESARATLACVAERELAGERLRVRIGINTGSLVAGNVGGGGRPSTVHGDTVNLPARLAALLPGAQLVAVGNIAVRGLAGWPFTRQHE